MKHLADDASGPLSPMSLPAPKQLKFTPGVVNGSVRESAAFLNQTRKVKIPASITLSLRLWCSIELRKLKVNVLVGADGANRTTVDEEAGNGRAGWWEAMEVEEKPSSVAAAVQMEVAKAVETLGVD